MVVGFEEIATNENNKSLLNIAKWKYCYLKDENWYEKNIDNNKKYETWLSDIENKIIYENIRRNNSLRSNLSGIRINR